MNNKESAETRRVRAYNVRIGDELDWFDTKTNKPVVMIVTGTDDSFPGVRQLYCKKKRGRVTYRWNMKATSLVGIRRQENK